MTAGIDLALALIEEDLGLEAAQRTARVLVVYHRRVGGQSHFSALLEAVERLRTEVAHTQLTGTTVSIEAIARQAGFSSAERTRRAFVRLYGLPPQAVRRIAQ